MHARRHGRLLSALAVASLLAPLASARAVAEGGCQEDPRNAVIARAVGVWEVVSDDGVVEGLAEVRPILGGCAFEVVRGEGGVEVARALIYRDAATDQWVERWVSRQGATARLEIEVVGDRLVLTGTIHDGEGGAVPGRLEFEPGPGGRFTRRLQLSLDGGETWEPPQVASYRRVDSSEDAPGTLATVPGAAEAAPAAPPVPVSEATAPEATVSEPAAPLREALVPAPAPSVDAGPGQVSPKATEETRPGAVKVRSERTRYQPPAATVTLESPMMLEIELGPVNALPAGTAWRTTETAVYLVDEVRMPQVGASRRERRGKVELEVTVNLRTTAMQRRVDLEIELLASGGESLGRERVDNIALGKLIGSHDPRVGRPTTLRFSMEEERFEALFANGKRPSARITVTVR